ncbi:phenylalanine--tRNA ligase subunit beta [Clostridium cellulovorans]|uniref:Phenylalanine--tRNA ligase beta subunit n=1 Tax=Clostridium cellulovorans (strain ATCC 35296 / DSM 3052 / OCM 3 / 743B) TaxID=573061 RepID=D9SN33_CLOC7|nr:phenylalanine--tRNA ligase subunit beta [Clostridium cellulovorans]ADL51899.1 phenylalanyl-tRNA synthetase, beta subunit [Clostridium cellulovorans 743B]
MLVPVKWLKDYVDFDISPKELGDRLTLSGSKLETVEVSGDEIKNVVTGKLIKIEAHPDAEKLSVCQVDINAEEPIQIVTAATNMKEQDIVPVALHGSVLAGGHKIKKGKLRGILSNGMFCSEEELGLAEEGTCHGLMILPESTPIGEDIKTVLSMGKAVLDFEITSNRPDCLSILGMARETAATINTKYKMPNFTYKTTSAENITDLLKVTIQDPLCRRYISKGVKNVKIQPSPAWMQERLEEAGVRPINNIVDITNFVMLELGQPMHAFDARDIRGNSIIVDRASNDEKFSTLDEIERTLTSDILTIRDGEGAIALAGIMGGLNSEIKDDTTTVFFESANFDGKNIRVSSKNLGLRTESSSRFEKDLDPNLPELAMNRALNLIEELGAGEIMEGIIDLYENPVKPHIIEIDSQWVNKFLGLNITKEEMKSCLDRLDLSTEIVDNTLKVTVPTFRIDLNIKEDIAEEIVRIYGYNNVVSTVPKVVSERSGKTVKQITDDLITDTLLGSGLYESISYSFFGEKDFDKVNIAKDSSLRNAVTIKNPLGEDYKLMRTTSLPSMMGNLARNYSRNNEEARLFEIGKVYIKSEDPYELPTEVRTLTIGLYGNVDYLDLKGVVENVLETLGIKKVSYERETENPTFHPGKTAKLMVGREFAGVFGEVHPMVNENWKVDERCYIAELYLDVLYKNASDEKKYKPLPKYPAVTRDLAILVDENILVQEIDEIIKKQGANMIEEVKLFDVYKGKQIPEGKKSVAYSLVYRLANKTLTDEEVNKTHQKILKTLEHKLGAELR